MTSRIHVVSVFVPWLFDTESSTSILDLVVQSELGFPYINQESDELSNLII